MGFGKSNQESSSSQTFDPQLKSALLGVFGEGQNLYDTLPYAPYNAATVAPFSAIEMAGMQGKVDAAQAGLGRGEVQDAIATTRDVTGFSPLQVQAGMIRPGNVRANNIGQLSQVGEGLFNPYQQMREQRITAPGALSADQLRAERLRDTDLSPYTNPYEDQVVQTTLDDIERARQMQQTQNQASATAAGAFGGDRAAIVEGQTNEAALREASRAAGGLRQQGFESASARAASDISRDLAAQQANQGANLQAGQFTRGQQLTSDQLNQAANMQSQMQNISNEIGRQRDQYGAQVQNVSNDMARQRANQEASLRARLANQQTNLAAGRANQESALRAALANQSADTAGAQMRLGAANQLANQGQTFRNLAFADADQIQNVGADQRGLAQALLSDQYNRFLEEREYPFRMFDVLRGAAGILPNPLTSQSRGSGSSTNFNLSAAG